MEYYRSIVKAIDNLIKSRRCMYSIRIGCLPDSGYLDLIPHTTHGRYYFCHRMKLANLIKCNSNY